MVAVSTLRVNSRTIGAYSFHNEVSSDALLFEDTTQRYSMGVEVSVEDAKLFIIIILLKLVKPSSNTCGKYDSSENKASGTLEKLRELETKLAESQDETKLREVTLETIPIVQNGWIHYLMMIHQK